MLSSLSIYTVGIGDKVQYVLTRKFNVNFHDLGNLSQLITDVATMKLPIHKWLVCVKFND